MFGGTEIKLLGHYGGKMVGCVRVGGLRSDVGLAALDFAHKTQNEFWLSRIGGGLRHE